MDTFPEILEMRPASGGGSSESCAGEMQGNALSATAMAAIKRRLEELRANIIEGPFCTALVIANAFSKQTGSRSFLCLNDLRIPYATVGRAGSELWEY